MRLKTIFYITFGLIFIFASCNKNKQSTQTQLKQQYDSKNRLYSSKPNSGGSAGEVEVVIPKKLWDGPVGDTIFYTLAQPFPALPQDEPFFKSRQVDPQNFQNIYKQHRNILIVRIGQQYKRGWKIENDVWAANQLVITYQAPNDQEFFDLFHKTSKRLLDTLYSMELRRYASAFAKYQNKKDMEEIEKLYHISLLIPDSYHLYVKKKNFAWISRETSKTSQDILIYIIPYKSKSDFDVNTIIRRRDSIAQLHVPGPSEGSYMQTEHLYPITSEVLKIDGHYAVLVRGLWKTHGDFLGGPFVSLSILDQKHDRIVTLDGFVYAGKLDKKLYLWQVESLIRTVKILD